MIIVVNGVHYVNLTTIYLFFYTIVFIKGDYIHMNRKLLSFLEEIKAQGNMSKAAEILFVTQPYISRVIKNAETQFGVRLIDRSSHPIQLTYAGERLLSYLQEENRLRSNLDREMTHLSEFKYGHLTIASNEVLDNGIFKPVLTQFYNKYPKIHAQLLKITSRDAENRLLSGSLDFFMGQPLHNNKIEYVPITNFPLVLIVPRQSSQFEEGTLWSTYSNEKVEEMGGESFIGIPHDSNYQRMVNNFFTDHGISVEYSIEVPDIHLATALALKQLGAIITPKHLLNIDELDEETKQNINLIEIPSDTFTSNFGVSYVKTKQNSEPVSDLVDIVTNVVNDLKE